MAQTAKRRVEFFAILAFALVVIMCFAQFFYARQITAEPWRVGATFALGGAYVVLFLWGGACIEDRGPRFVWIYFLAHCALLTVMLFITPVHGFFGVIVLPLVAHAILELGWKASTAITVYLFAANLGMFAWHLGWHVVPEVALSYSTGFAFTSAFTHLTARAQRARQDAERLAGELSAANQQLRAHAAETEKLATIEERNRLAREIHDGVGHYLTVVKVQLDAADALLPHDPARAAASVRTASRLAAEALDDVRRSVSTLGADTARPPLTDVLRQLAADATPPLEFQIIGPPRPLCPAAEHALFRTAQEGLTNVHKHAAATAVTLTLDYRDPQRVRLTLVDNGRSESPPAPVANGSGHGLRGLRERFALLNGTLLAARRPEGGFMLSAEVPA